MKLDSETMKQAVSKAILDSLGEDGKSLILEQAVASLLEKDDSKRYNYNETAPTKIQKMFADAAKDAAWEVVRDELRQSEEFKQKIRDMVMKATNAMFESDRLAEKMAELVEETVSKLTLSRDY